METEIIEGSSIELLISLFSGGRRAALNGVIRDSMG